MIPNQAGLVAYTWGYRGAFWNYNGGKDFGYEYLLDVKDYLFDELAYRRLDMADQLVLPEGTTLPYPAPTEVKVAYNGARGEQKGKRDRGPASSIVCSFMNEELTFKQTA